MKKYLTIVTAVFAVQFLNTEESLASAKELLGDEYSTTVSLVQESPILLFNKDKFEQCPENSWLVKTDTGLILVYSDDEFHLNFNEDTAYVPTEEGSTVEMSKSTAEEIVTKMEGGTKEEAPVAGTPDQPSPEFVKPKETEIPSTPEDPITPVVE